MTTFGVSGAADRRELAERVGEVALRLVHHLEQALQQLRVAIVFAAPLQRCRGEPAERARKTTTAQPTQAHLGQTKLRLHQAVVLVVVGRREAGKNALRLVDVVLLWKETRQRMNVWSAETEVSKRTNHQRKERAAQSRQIPEHDLRLVL
jgi:hypothetical protein